MKVKSVCLSLENAREAAHGLSTAGRLGRAKTETRYPDLHTPLSLETIRRQVDLAVSRGLPQGARARSVMQDRPVSRHRILLPFDRYLCESVVG